MTSLISPLLRTLSNFNVVSRSISLFRSSTPAVASTGLNNNNIITSSFLSPRLPILSQVCGFKVKLKLRKRCKDCYFVVRNERSYVICPTHPRHKQMSMIKKPKYTWILTHASQSKIRPW